MDNKELKQELDKLSKKKFSGRFTKIHKRYD